MHRFRTPHRLTAATIALGLALCAVAPHAMARGSESVDGKVAPVRGEEEPCPMHPGGPAGDSEQPGAPEVPSFGCCAVGVAANGTTLTNPPAAAVALVHAPVVSAPTPRLLAQAAARRPAPPGPLHLLHGCFLT